MSLDNYQFQNLSVYTNDRPTPSVFSKEMQMHQKLRINAMETFETYQEPTEVDPKFWAAVEADPSLENLIALDEEITSINHFVMLKTVPALAGVRWPINEQIYWYFLEILPPARMGYHWFTMSEEKGNGVTSKYEKVGSQYWHEYVKSGV